ncbi:RluA family pseudouridine synthase [Pseudohoeflea coraliihabitans]|uniref:Pseudouridine synthase n=1 Tax=Pseudohoeflea coraliihabitans TaxID=2860393 RepID=A0ABS6WJZ7_9HYPH|nr:RluA family pseudouridine synthase [Pseudohoeflea sp. DP4N28-3]MBW3096271.1 RluA family pseudouridine synthase [Pseudohoeflea sp. DP4N28-3]
MNSGSPFSESTSDRKAFRVDDDGGRLDAWIAAQLAPDYSRSRIKVLIKEGHVRLNAEVSAEPNRQVTAGDLIEIALPEAVDPQPKGEAIALDVLFEDSDLIVLNKPPGMVVHPAAGNWTGTLVNALIAHCGDSLSGIGGVRRPGIVHRLDKDTSGVMVVAKTDVAHRHLAAQFADHGRTGALERAYTALVWGRPKTLAGTIDAPLGRARDRLRRAVRSDQGSDVRHAVTHYQVRARYGETPEGALASRIECRLETGRTHQIRVHMAHIGHPLIGDRDYGAAFRTKAHTLPDAARQAVERFGRQALHAHLLAFIHPRSEELLRLEAPPPKDMAALQMALEGMASHRR